MSKGDRYLRLVEWSDEDGCFIGSCPELFSGGCHGTDAQRVFAELCELIDETVALYEQDGKPLPDPWSGRDFVNALLGHRRLAGRRRPRPRGVARPRLRVARAGGAVGFLAPRITVDEHVRFGRPVIEGTRVPVEVVIGRLAAGLTVEDLCAEYDLMHEGALAALGYAASVLAEEQVRAVV